MSRSVRKHRIAKAGDSWHWDKKMINRYNRNVARQSLRNDREPNPTDKKLCSIDYDYCKYYYTKDEIKEFPKVMRK